MDPDVYENRLKGCFYGCAVGDALGAPLEFHERDEVPLVTEMLPAEHFKLPAGSWTDDTSLMLCLAASIVARNGFDPHSELSHYMEWFSNGYLSVSGYAFDMGRTTMIALMNFENEGRLVAKPSDGCCGNGSLMRLAPVPIFVSKRDNPDYELAWRAGYDSSKTTHSHSLCCESCGLYSVLIVGALCGLPKYGLLKRLSELASTKLTDARLVALCDGTFVQKTRDEIRSHGFVLDTLEAALWAFFNTDTFEEGAVLAVNLGHDADTVGSVYGTLAGAFYGFSEIPTRWMDALQGRRMLDGVWADLLEATRTS